MSSFVSQTVSIGARGYRHGFVYEVHECRDRPKRDFLRIYMPAKAYKISESPSLTTDCVLDFVQQCIATRRTGFWESNNQKWLKNAQGVVSQYEQDSTPEAAL
jgi:hypothetical protein